MSYCQKKKKWQKLRGREFRLITVTEGMMPIGMSLKFKNSCRPKRYIKYSYIKYGGDSHFGILGYSQH